MSFTQVWTFSFVDKFGQILSMKLHYNSYIHLSVYLQAQLIPVGVTELLEHLLLKAGYTLDRLTITGSHNHTHSHLSLGTIESPINLWTMSLNCGRKLKCLETHARGEGPIWDLNLNTTVEPTSLAKSQIMAQLKRGVRGKIWGPW